jgi:diaminohydroxyphosphoribosylaminopyrimidine deaminase/5-amino-6-(5-phosphoribosylamino)uracil reductase
VIAVIDPTSRGDGGVAELCRAGVDVETGVLADEARIVLGDWLTGLRNRRPVVTWPYLITNHGLKRLPADTGEARLLRLNADAVLAADGTVREAVPGSHGEGILALQDQSPGTSATQAVAALYDGGVRRLLLDGAHAEAMPFLGAALVDRVVAYLPHGNASSRPAVELPWPLLPPGFAMTGTSRTENFVRVDGQPGALRLALRVPSVRCPARSSTRRGIVLFLESGRRAPAWPFATIQLEAQYPAALAAAMSALTLPCSYELRSFGTNPHRPAE